MLRSNTTATQRLKIRAWLTSGLVWALIYLNAASAAQQPELIIQAGFSTQTPIVPDAQIELRLNRPLLVSEGKLAVLLGQTDLTALFIATENVLRYGPPALPLP